ncbi:hypothetical protein, partial [Nocardioides massiliensis]
GGRGGQVDGEQRSCLLPGILCRPAPGGTAAGDGSATRSSGAAALTGLLTQGLPATEEGAR